MILSLFMNEDNEIFILDLKEKSIFNQPKVLFRDAVGISLLLMMAFYTLYHLIINLI